jgi:hypothetical protein
MTNNLIEMIVKSEEWAYFKKAIFYFMEVFENESKKLHFTPENDYDFTLFVDECRVYPVFTKKTDFQKVEYDFTNCEIEIRTLSFSRYKDAARVEMTLKKKKD